MTVQKNSSGSPPQITLPHFQHPFVDPGGQLTQPWYRILVEIWRRLGGSQANTPGTLYVQIDPNGNIGLYNVQNNEEVGILPVIPLTPPAVVPIPILGASPFIYKSDSIGSIVFDSGAVDISRDSGITWYTGFKVGGAMLIGNGDWVRFTWFESSPVVAFFPLF